MKKAYTLLCLGCLIFILSNCAPKTGKSVAGSSISKAPKPTYTAVQVQEGMVAYKSSCGSCHMLHNTTEYNQKEWNNILVSMLPRTQLDESKSLSVRAYIMTNAKSN